MKRSGGRLAEVKSIERSSADGVHGVDVQVDAGDEEVTAEHYGEPGVDALPLPGDQALLQAAEGAGAESVSEYLDPKNEGKALPGERRTFARDEDGNVVVEFWLKRDGSGVLSNEHGKFTLKPDGSLDYNDGAFTCDTEGNAVFKGEVTAKAASPATAVTLSQHVHPTGVGPSGPAQPGT